MAEYLIQDTTLVNIGNAIRVKSGKNEPIPVPDLAQEIMDLPVGGYTLFLTVIATPGSIVTLSKGNKSYTKKTDEFYNVAFSGLDAGVWTAVAVDDILSTSIDIDVTKDMTYKFYLTAIPAFTYTGNYALVDDNDKPIDASPRDWKLKFYSSGTLTFTELNGADDGIDVFLVGGGGNGSAFSVYDAEGNGTHGSGGGGGYTKTVRNIPVSLTSYDITVGGSQQDSHAFGETAACGSPGGYIRGGNGGSGGGAAYTNGGYDGGDGSWWGNSPGGTGQHSTTREFGEPNGTLYSSGGGGSRPGGAAGDGGYGGPNSITPPGKGAAGIVIIRNKR